MKITETIQTEFEKATGEQWEKLFLKEVKQEQLQSRHSIFGFDYLPIYSASGVQSSYQVKENSWNINHHFYWQPNVNTQILEALNNGVSSLTMIGDPVSTQELHPALKGVEANYLEINFNGIVEPLKTSQVYHSYSTIAGNDTSKVFGYIQNDFLGNALFRGGWKNSIDADRAEFIKAFEFIQSNFRLLDAVTVNACVFHYAGATLPQTIAYTLLQIVEYVTILSNAGYQVESILDRLVVQWPVGIHYFGEIAAIRALKESFRKIVSHITGKESSIELTIHAEVSLNFWSVADINNNMLRATTQAMSAVIGGVNSLTVFPYSVVAKPEDEFASRIASNVQLLLREESYLNKAEDPATGSYFVEALTQQLVEKSMNLFKHLESSGGFTANMINDSLQNSLADSFQQTSSLLKEGSIKILGLNLFPDKNEKRQEAILNGLNGGIEAATDFKKPELIRFASLAE